MTEADLTRLTELAKAGTPGKWNDGIYHAATSGARTYAHITANGVLVPVTCVPLSVDGYGREEGEANARLIVAAVNALPDLLAEIERLKGQVATLSAGIAAAGQSGAGNHSGPFLVWRNAQITKALNAVSAPEGDK